MNIIRKIFGKNKKKWYPQNDEEIDYCKYYYNVNSSQIKIKPKDKYPHECDDNDEFLENYIKEYKK